MSCGVENMACEEIDRKIKPNIRDLQKRVKLLEAQVILSEALVQKLSKLMLDLPSVILKGGVK